MRRREFITLVGGATVAWPLAARAQQPALPVIGYLGNDSNNATYPAAFRKWLSEIGYVEGQNVAIEYRWIESQIARLPALLSDLVGRPVAVIAATVSLAAVLAAKAATQTIPIVFRIGSDPVANGLVASLNRPGGNVTGIATLGGELAQKRLALLRELLPAGAAGAAVVLLANPTSASAAIETKEIQTAAGVRLLILYASSPSDIEAAFVSIARQDTSGTPDHG